MSFWHGKGRNLPKAGQKVAGSESEINGSCGIDDRLVHQQNRDIVSNGVDPATLGTLQAGAIFLEQQRFSASGANQDVEQVLRNHRKHFTPFRPAGHRLKKARKDLPAPPRTH